VALEGALHQRQHVPWNRRSPCGVDTPMVVPGTPWRKLRAGCRSGPSL
jgi:hypothetical protein